MYFFIMINLLWKQILLKIVSIFTKEAGGIIDFLQAENKILRSKIVNVLSRYEIYVIRFYTLMIYFFKKES